MVEYMLPEFGYTPEQILIVRGIIEATKSSVEPRNILEEIMCDADHDYLGRPDYYAIANKLRMELAIFGETMSDPDWTQFQLNFLKDKHHYYTDTAQNIREIGKKARIRELLKKQQATK